VGGERITEASTSRTTIVRENEIRKKEEEKSSADAYRHSGCERNTKDDGNNDTREPTAFSYCAYLWLNIQSQHSRSRETRSTVR